MRDLWWYVSGSAKVGLQDLWERALGIGPYRKPGVRGALERVGRALGVTVGGAMLLTAGSVVAILLFGVALLLSVVFLIFYGLGRIWSLFSGRRTRIIIYRRR